MQKYILFPSLKDKTFNSREKLQNFQSILFPINFELNLGLIGAKNFDAKNLYHTHVECIVYDN